MKKIIAPLLTSIALVTLLTGCAATSQNRPMTVALVRMAVNTGALFGIEQEPTCVYYLKAAAPVICNAAGNGNLNPAKVVAALQSADVDLLKTPIGVSIINSGLALYEAIYTAYGTNVQNSVMQPYLEGICLGLEDAVGMPTTSLIKRNTTTLPPHIRYRYP